ncbi:hypothetical protein Tco_0102921 [Tanacetum coccineum]
MRAPLRAHFKDLPTSDMKEILLQRMLEENSDKGHEDHKMALKHYKNLSFVMKVSNLMQTRLRSEQRRKVSKIHRKPHLGRLLLHLLLYHRSSKTTASTKYTAWKTTTSRLKPAASSVPKDVLMHEESDFDAQDMGSNDEDSGSRHIPKVSLNQEWFKPLSEKERPATPEPAWSIPSLRENLCFTGPVIFWSVIDWFCKKQGITELTPKHLEGPAYEVTKDLSGIMSATTPPLGSLQGRLIDSRLNFLQQRLGMVPDQMWAEGETSMDAEIMRASTNPQVLLIGIFTTIDGSLRTLGLGIQVLKAQANLLELGKLLAMVARFTRRRLQTSSGTNDHIFLYLLGLRGSKKLNPGSLSLYVGNGQREAVVAIGNYHLCVPSGLLVILNNCHYAPSITRGIILVSRSYEDGFINRFELNNTIPVSKNNVVYFTAIPRDGLYEIEIHISKKHIEKLQHDGLLNFTDIESLGMCVSCMSGYPKETMRYSFYNLSENKVFVARNAKFFESNLIDQEASGSLEDLKIIQEEDTNPSLDTSLNHEEDDQEIDEPQSDINLIRRSTRTRRLKD